MLQIAIPFYSTCGSTERLARIICDACIQPGVTAHLFAVETLDAHDWESLSTADAIIFGSPTYMGGVAAPFKAFMDASSDIWVDQVWSDKLAAGFTVGANNSGDKLATLQHMSIFAAQHGMVWLGQNQIGQAAAPDKGAYNTDGFWLGLAATSRPGFVSVTSPTDRQSATAFGNRIAAATLRWNR